MGKIFSKQENTKDTNKNNSATELENIESIYVEEDLKDPRSPHPYNVCRTPINECTETKSVLLEENPSNSFKRRLLQTLKLTPFDPRSPSNLINRTPIVFDADDSDRGAEKVLNLNDTFSDLFIETYPLDIDDEHLSPISVSDNVEEPSKISIVKLEEHKDSNEFATCLDAMVQDGINEIILGERDPRSPSIEVNRTPIVFEEDHSSTNELEMIENVLDSIKFCDEKPKHKLVERVKNPPNRKTRTCSRLVAKRNFKMKINNENSIYSNNQLLSSTPKRKTLQLEEKRTPLGCVGNKSHLRTSSNENSIDKKFFMKSSSLNTKSFSENPNEMQL